MLRRVQARVLGDFQRAVAAYQQHVTRDQGTGLTGAEATVLLRLSSALAPTTP